MFISRLNLRHKYHTTDMEAVTTPPPLPLLSENDSSHFHDSSHLPPGKALAYITIFEDAQDQLQVLSDILPEQMKTDNKAV
jgi:hypothetical protein